MVKDSEILHLKEELRNNKNEKKIISDLNKKLRIILKQKKLELKNKDKKSGQKKVIKELLEKLQIRLMVKNIIILKFVLVQNVVHIT